MNELLKMLLEDTDPNTLAALIPVMVEKYKKLAYVAGNELLKVMKDYNETDVFDVRAIAKKKQFDAYVNIGFTEEQAIAFIINDNLKLMEQIKKVSSKSTKTKND